MLRLALLAMLASACGSGEPDPVRVPFARDPPAVGPLHGRLLVANNGDDSLSVLSPEPGAEVRRLPVGLSPVEPEGPHGLAVDPAGRHVFLALTLKVAGASVGPHGSHGGRSAPGHVLKLNVADGRVAAAVTVEEHPAGIVLSPDGRTLYVVHYDVDGWFDAITAGDGRAATTNLLVIETESMRVSARVPLCAASRGLALAGDAQTLFATCGPDEVAVVDLRVRPPTVERVPIPGEFSVMCHHCPYALAVSPDGLVWIAALGRNGGGVGGRVLVFDPDAAPRRIDPSRGLALRGAPGTPLVRDLGADYRVYVPERRPLEDDLLVLGPPSAEGLQTLHTVRLSPADCVRAMVVRAVGPGDRGQVVCEGDGVEPGRLVWLDLGPGSGPGQAPVALGSVPLGLFPADVALVPPR